MSEQLNYKVEDTVLAELLGRQNFTKKEAAILEIVKNAYDSGSATLDIIFDKDKNGKNEIIFVDYGQGMSYEDITESWMHVGKSSRKYIDKKNGRVYAGSKGIGKFALSRLGKDIELITKKENFQEVTWTTNWESTEIEYSNILEGYLSGTTIVIRELRDRWTERIIQKFEEYLSRVYISTDMKINIIIGNDVLSTDNYFSDAELGQDYVSEIKLDFDSEGGMLTVEINSDEFSETAKSIVGKNFSLDNVTSKINIFERMDSLKNFDEEIDVTNRIENIKKLGDFRANLFFINRPSKLDKNRFEYKRIGTEMRNSKSGITLYRNAFSVDSYEGATDWLGITKRASKSPAAATHPTGRWRVRVNQLFGTVFIDKKRNSEIQDLSNRQGIEDNVTFRLMKNVITTGIDEFEAYRQNIIKIINRFKLDEEEEFRRNQQKEKTITEMLSDFQKKINREALEDFNQLKVKIEINEEERQAEKKSVIDMKNSLHYESQLLNVLATSQLRVSASAHEIKNAKSNIRATPFFLKEALQKELDWDYLTHLNSVKAENIPMLLETLTVNTRKIVSFTDVMLNSMEKEKFEVKDYNLKTLLSNTISDWQKNYKSVKFELKAPEVDVKISFDTLSVILNNLILNSIQQNDKKNDLKISVFLTVSFGKLFISYKDNGKGLTGYFAENPLKILEPLETDKKFGHGLGMWIVNNTLDKQNGEVLSITGDNSFELEAVMDIEKVD